MCTPPGRRTVGTEWCLHNTAWTSAPRASVVPQLVVGSAHAHLVAWSMMTQRYSASVLHILNGPAKSMPHASQKSYTGIPPQAHARLSRVARVHTAQLAMWTTTRCFIAANHTRVCNIQ